MKLLISTPLLSSLLTAPLASGRRPLMGRSTRRSLQNDDSCTAENEVLASYGGALGNMNHDDVNAEDGIFFFQLSESRDYSSYEFDCDTTVSPSVCDYTTLADAMKPACEFAGGTLYLVAGSGDCGPDAGGPYQETNFPICIGPSCDVQPKVDLYANGVEGCTALSDYVSEQSEYILDAACQAEFSMLLKSGSGVVDGRLGIGNSGYVFSGAYESRFDEFCPGDSSKCDFSSVLDEIKAECEGLGGYLYVFDDTTVTETTYPDTGESETSSTESTNIPICVGASCNAEVFFNELVFPSETYGLGGSYLPDKEDRNATRVTEYSAGNYKAISDLSTRPAPTSAPAPPTTSAASGLRATQIVFSTLFVVVGFVTFSIV